MDLDEKILLKEELWDDGRKIIFLHIEGPKAKQAKWQGLRMKASPLIEIHLFRQMDATSFALLYSLRPSRESCTVELLFFLHGTVVASHKEELVGTFHAELDKRPMMHLEHPAFVARNFFPSPCLKKNESVEEGKFLLEKVREGLKRWDKNFLSFYFDEAKVASKNKEERKKHIGDFKKFYHQESSYQINHCEHLIKMMKIEEQQQILSQLLTPKIITNTNAFMDILQKEAADKESIDAEVNKRKVELRQKLMEGNNIETSYKDNLMDQINLINNLRRRKEEYIKKENHYLGRLFDDHNYIRKDLILLETRDAWKETSKNATKGEKEYSASILKKFRGDESQNLTLFNYLLDTPIPLAVASLPESPLPDLSLVTPSPLAPSPTKKQPVSSSDHLQQLHEIFDKFDDRDRRNASRFDYLTHYLSAPHSKVQQKLYKSLSNEEKNQLHQIAAYRDLVESKSPPLSSPNANLSSISAQTPSPLPVFVPSPVSSTASLLPATAPPNSSVPLPSPTAVQSSSPAPAIERSTPLTPSESVLDTWFTSRFSKKLIPEKIPPPLLPSHNIRTAFQSCEQFPWMHFDNTDELQNT